ncbi:MAG TPA: hypothetical protein VJ939_05495 [Bacteroidales bacterium]|nr:hypothetical protein [Bacteroidales bacterium]
MKNFAFWKNSLITVNLVTIGIGLLIAFAGNSFLFEIHNDGTYQTFFDGNAPSEKMMAFKDWLFGIIGATIVGFHTLIVYIAKYPFTRKEKWARNAIAMAMTTWFILDSALSISFGAFYNVYLINIPSYVLIMLPVIMTWKSFGGDLRGTKNAS